MEQFQSIFLILYFTSTSNAGMKIQFFGAKQDGNRVRDAIHKMVERGRVANITLVPSSLTFREEAVLQIEVCISFTRKKKLQNGQLKRDVSYVFYTYLCEQHDSHQNIYTNF